jgi:ABC-2 type transport system ATP-binding protein
MRFFYPAPEPKRDARLSGQDTPIIVVAERVGHSYATREALHDISFTVRSGEIFGVLGPNGSGKSTLFRILSTSMSPSRGRAFVGGHDVTRNVMQARRHIGVVFQSQTLDEQLTIVENLRCQGRMYGIPGVVLSCRIELLMHRLNLFDLRNKKVAVLSGGQRRQIDVAKAMLHQPPVLFLDEPSSGLDPGARVDLWQQIRQLNLDNATTVLMTTHILEEADRCDRLLILNRGKAVAEGTPACLRSRIQGEVVVLKVSGLKEMQDRIRGRFGVRPTIVHDALHLETANGARFVRDVIEAFPGAVESISVHRPSLEDVFAHETGELMAETPEPMQTQTAKSGCNGSRERNR